MTAPGDHGIVLNAPHLVGGTKLSPWWQNQRIRLEHRTAILTGRVCGPCNYVGNGWCSCGCHGGAR